MTKGLDESWGLEDKIKTLESKLELAVKLAKMIRAYRKEHGCLSPDHAERKILDLADAVLGENKCTKLGASTSRFRE